MKKHSLKAVVVSTAIALATSFMAAPVYAYTGPRSETVVSHSYSEPEVQAEPMGPIHCIPLGSTTPMDVNVDRSAEIRPLCTGHRIPMSIAGFQVTRHAAKRMGERNVSPTEVHSAITKGRKYYDPDHDSYPFYFGGVTVPTKNGVITTVIKNEPIPDRFISIW